MSHSTPRTMANMLFESLSGDKQREINSQKVCKYCKMVTDHLISNYPKLAKKEKRRISVSLTKMSHIIGMDLLRYDV